jgi:acyl-CoA synthetase (AMP-forming)/AMP-acid ligase II
MEPGVVPPSLEELRQQLGGKLSAYKMPRSVEYVDEIKRSDAGKVRRKSYRPENA